MSRRPDHEVAIVGAGFSGIGAAIKLDEAGIRRLVVLEAGDGVGGAWHWNTYPGIGVDIPSFSYQFSFEQRADWSRVYAPGERAEGLRRALRRQATGCARGSASTRKVDAARRSTRRRTSGGSTTAAGEPITARYVVGATGVFTPAEAARHPGPRRLRRHRDAHRALGPRRRTCAARRVGDHRHRRLGGPGDPLDRARGRAADRLPAHADLVPAEARRADSARACGGCSTAFPARQRARARLASQAFVELDVPAAGALPRRRPARQARRSESGRKHLREQVHDPEVREKLTPRYGLGCKRPGFSNEYLPTFNRAERRRSRRPRSRRSRRTACAPPTAPSTSSTC